jgi:hypothetical protein
VAKSPVPTAGEPDGSSLTRRFRLPAAAILLGAITGTGSGTGSGSVGSVKEKDQPLGENPVQ